MSRAMRASKVRLNLLLRTKSEGKGWPARAPRGSGPEGDYLRVPFAYLMEPVSAFSPASSK